jgi:hypothetical protein
MASSLRDKSSQNEPGTDGRLTRQRRNQIHGMFMMKRLKKVVGIYDKRSGKIGIHTWNLDAVKEGMEDVINNALKEAMEIATSEYPCTAWFVNDFSDDPNADMSMIAVSLQLDDGEGEEPTWEFSLSDLVRKVVDYADDEDRPKIVTLRDLLRDLADELDEAMARSSV